MNEICQMTNESRYILNELLDRYENSKLFKEGTSNQRVYIKFGKCKVLISRIKDIEDKKRYLNALENLQEQGIVSYTWVRYEKDNLVDSVYLSDDPEVIERCYEAIGRVPKQQMLDDLEEMLRDIYSKIPDTEADLSSFFQEVLDIITTRKVIPRFFFRIEAGDAAEKEYKDVKKKNQRLLQFLLLLTEIADSQQEQMERVLSAALFGDSKYFERELKNKVLSILRYLHEDFDKGQGREPVTDEQLLAERGVVKWPEVLEFCGDIAICLDDGTTIDYSGQIYGAYINARTVHHIKSIDLAGADQSISRLISIENKANYTWYLEQKRKDGELVLYHGGVYSPVKGLWFRLLADTLKNKDVPVYHWSDIDLGGFCIFRRLKTQVFSNLLPWKMDLETIQNNREHCMEIQSELYLQNLEKLLADPGLQMFHDVIRYMLQERVRLEQEQLITITI